MNEITERINKENMKKYGPVCSQCEYYAKSCRCNTNNTHKNKDLASTLQKTYTHLRNGGYMKDQVMDAPVQVLGRELLTVLHSIELSGKTVEEVLSHVNNNFKQYG